jgi:hypothetical protein
LKEMVVELGVDEVSIKFSIWVYENLCYVFNFN